MISDVRIKEMIDEVLKEQETMNTSMQKTVNEIPSSQNNTTNETSTKVVVNFDTKTNNPYTVEFSERGFLVHDTRLSFEAIENALSKEYSIVLKDGFILDQVKMQKIMKYKDRV